MALKRPEGMTDEEFVARANEKARKKKAAPPSSFLAPPVLQLYVAGHHAGGLALPGLARCESGASAGPDTAPDCPESSAEPFAAEGAARLWYNDCPSSIKAASALQTSRAID